MSTDHPLKQIENWVFDLDNTLYPASIDLFPQIDRKMKGFITERLKLSPEEAFRLQKQYFHEFGTTLRGLMLHHQIEPDEFLDYVHDIDHGALSPLPRLAEALTALPGRKLIFTNGSESHAVKVLERLGLSCQFEGIFDIRAAQYVPKPYPETYQRLCLRHQIDPRASAFFEDIARNLKPAAEIGMTTIWVRAHVEDHLAAEDAPFVHHIVDDLTEWLSAAPQ